MEIKSIGIEFFVGAVELNCKQFQNVYIRHEFLMLLNPKIFGCVVVTVCVVRIEHILYNRALSTENDNKKKHCSSKAKVP